MSGKGRIHSALRWGPVDRLPIFIKQMGKEGEEEQLHECKMLRMPLAISSELAVCSQAWNAAENAALDRITQGGCSSSEGSVAGGWTWDGRWESASWSER